MDAWYKNKPLTVFATILVSIFTGCDEQKQHSSVNQATATPGTSKTNQIALIDSARYLYDVPSLLNLTARRIQSKLGHPVSNLRESINEEVKTLRYNRRGYELSIDYVVSSDSIISIYLTNKSMKPYEKFINAGNLTRYKPEHKIDTLNGERGVYEGISITLSTKSI